MGRLTPAQALGLYSETNPFESASAIRASNYSAYIDGKLTRLLDWREPSAQARMAHDALRGFLLSDGFSCVAGKGAVQSGGYRFGYYKGFPAGADTEGLARDLCAFAAERPSMDAPYATFIAVFDRVEAFGERWFEKALWEQLQRLHDLDAPHHPWDPHASSDPADASFAFSFAGCAFYVVGMHPGASRRSRRFFLPALVFNAHDQFRTARESGAFGRIQRAVRERELALQGSLNPELREFGSTSEARQYSGRQTESGWECPFRARRSS
ncbi:MAG TPA: guanitoxin biosynthesis heme-dependent pre-guanitoxin N-hydroxylase GntA [Candidatus Baltobacteraceae bacterium]|nr:guanitoxin biosynthesis heme-dependent pre-guanitoxin N-hydroxylase GntA [Candidatus Baltobacteraceae bacterium]